MPFSANACIAPRAKVALRMPPPEMHRALRGDSRSCIFRKRSCSVSAAHSVFSRRVRYSSVSTWANEIERCSDLGMATFANEVARSTVAKVTQFPRDDLVRQVACKSNVVLVHEKEFLRS